MPFASIPEALEAFRAGQMIVVVDDEDRENEGDLTIAAEKVTPEIINFMAVHGRGLICLALAPERCDQLHLPLMSPRNTSNFGTAFTESVDAREGVSTGISAADRAHTIQVAMRPDAKPQDLSRPGHMFPLRAREGGVLVRAGQTEAAVDLARLCGLEPGGVICEIMNEDGTMSRVPDLERFCAHHHLLMITVADLIRYRLRTERFLQRTGEGRVRTPWGEFRTIRYGSPVIGHSHLALVYGQPDAGDTPALVRMHRHCSLGDVFRSQDCQCHALIHGALQRISAEGKGVLVYLHQDSDGLRSHEGRLLAHGRDFTAWGGDGPSSLHETGIGAQILADLGLSRVRLMTNRPRKVVGIEAYGIEIVDLVPIEMEGTAVPGRP